MFSAISYIIVSNTFVLGIVLIALGLIALYIGQIHAEVIGRPLYVIREKIRSVPEN
jgi:dolichol-phosphate mannosyltransferase